MANFILDQTPRFPNGTEVKAYAISNWPAGQVKTDAAPVGSAASTQTMTNGTLTFTGLTDETRYVAHAEVSGSHRYVEFTAGADTPGGMVRIEEVDGLQAALDAKQNEAQEAWLEVGGSGVAFATGWSNLGVGLTTCGYMKDTAGRVHLKGTATKGATGTGLMFTLPAGYRPAVADEIHVVLGGAAAGSVVRLTIGDDGTVTSATSTSGHYTTLDGVSFTAA